MKIAVSCVAVLVACGGGKDPKVVDAPPITIVDSATSDATSIDAPVVVDAQQIDAQIDAPVNVQCDPFGAAGMQGCAAGEKCTWIYIADDTGKLGCVADGTVAIGGSCTRGPTGETTGYDDCTAAGICIGGTCKDICGFEGSATQACASGESCTRYSGLGANGDDSPVMGACNATCDPLTQTRIVNGMTTDCGAGQGCYLLASTVDTIAVCAGASTPTHNMPIVGPTFANSCAPGHVPRQAVQGVTGNECASLCKPADVYMGNNESKEGGDPTVLNYANLPATCESAGGASVRPEVPATGETCTYYWTREPSANITNFSNTLGWCFNHASWKYDPDGMEPINNTAAYPRCPTLTTGDVVPPVDPAMPHNDALYFGCLALPAAKQSMPRPKPAPIYLDRLGPVR